MTRILRALFLAFTLLNHEIDHVAEETENLVKIEKKVARAIDF